MHFTIYTYMYSVYIYSVYNLCTYTLYLPMYQSNRIDTNILPVFAS